MCAFDTKAFAAKSVPIDTSKRAKRQRQRACEAWPLCAQAILSVCICKSIKLANEIANKSTRAVRIDRQVRGENRIRLAAHSQLRRLFHLSETVGRRTRVYRRVRYKQRLHSHRQEAANFNVSSYNIAHTRITLYKAYNQIRSSFQKF